MTQYTVISGVLHSREIDGAEWERVPDEAVLELVRSRERMRDAIVAALGGLAREATATRQT